MHRVLSSLVLAGVIAITVSACSDDDGGGGAGAGAGGEGATSSGGDGDGAGTDSGGTPALGGAGGAESGGAKHAEGGMTGESGSGGQGGDGHDVAGGNAGGAAGEAAGGAAGQAAAGASGAGGQSPDPVPRIACPALGEPFVLEDVSGIDDEQRAAALAVGCDLRNGRRLEVRRFQVATKSAVVMYSPRTLSEVLESFRLDPDCETTDVLTEQDAPWEAHYPQMVAQVVEPGTYTAVTCAEYNKLVVEPAPPPPTNVDCDHATPLTSKIEETRIFEPSRYYSVSTLDEEELSIKLQTPQTNASGTFTLRRDGITIATVMWPYLSLSTPLSFGIVEPGDYCIKVAVSAGTQYSIQ
jgi:hypothetical protein